VESLLKIRTDGSRTILRDLLRRILYPAVKKYCLETDILKISKLSDFHGCPSILVEDNPVKKLVPK
jgi:hypothetical protein